jgi:hypothetical protein
MEVGNVDKNQCERFSVTSARSLREVMAIFEPAVGHPDIAAFWENVRTAEANPDMTKVIQAGLGPSGFMIAGAGKHAAT